mgnify:CR=1 FL=1|tara:strand:- start:44 stop:667 length:624 start_codon:yes stop_codon:yes gene_type:complete
MAIYKNLKKALADSDNAFTLNIKTKGEKLPSELIDLPKLEALYIKSTELSNLDFPFEKLTKLKVFYVGSPKLQTLTESILTHPTLETLSATDSNIQELELRPNLNLNLKTLLLNKNKMTSVPKYLEHLESLENLNLSDNQLTELPEVLRLLNNLKTLSLNRNQLTTLPIELVKNWKSLHSLSLDGNKFDEETKDIIEQELNYWFGEL